MPRIRKKTSNRQATRDRAKITKKVAEHKKKAKRETKRQTTWKSKKKADPGVPNSFHLKDQVLAEMAEEKRLAAEAKANRRKGAVEDEEDAPGVSSVAGSAVLDHAPLTATASLPTEAESDDDDVPALLDSDLPTLQAALDAADILLEVVDARDIAGGRSATVENLVSEAEGLVFIVINKIDLVPREALEGWLAHLPFPAFLFSARENLGREQLLGALAAAAQAKEGEPLKAALLGLPNVGKSSVINSLLGKNIVKTAPAAPTASSAKSPNPTTNACREVEVTLPEGLVAHLIDTPGWEYVEEDEDEDEDPEDNIKEMDEDDEEEEQEEDEDKWDALEARVAGDLLRRNLGRVDKVKDVFPLVNYIVSRSNAQDLMLKYNVPYFEQGDVEAFLTGVARVHQRVRKHGEPNHEAAARIVLADWALNTFPYYTTAPKGDIAMETDDMGKPDMGDVLAQCKTRKELKAAGLIRFQTSEVDTRDVFLDDDYTEVPADLEDMIDFDEDDEDMEDDMEDDEDEDEDDDEDDEGVMIGSDEGEEVELEDGPEPSSGSDVEDDDDDEDSESEEEEPAPPVRAGKRKAPDSPEVRTKKVKVSKSVSFKAKLEAPKSVSREVKEVKSILKKKADEEEPTPAPKLVKHVAKKAKVDKPAKKAEKKPTKTKSSIVQAPLPAPVVKAPKERKTPEERKALREAKRAAKAEKKAAAPAPAPAPVAETKKAGKKAAANGKTPNGKAAKPVAPGEYDFSKHF